MKIERNTNKIERNTNVVYLARPDSNSWEQRSVERRLKKNKLRIGTFLWTILRNRYVKFVKIYIFELSTNKFGKFVQYLNFL